MRLVEVFQASGHAEITANHKTTLEITKDRHLTRNGDCIVAVGASKGAADLSTDFSKLLKNDNTEIVIAIKVAGRTETIRGRGDARLTLTHPTDLVARKSTYTCSRTVMVEADRSAADLSRRFVMAIRDPFSAIAIEIVAEL